jgi:hypothetical protein
MFFLFIMVLMEKKIIEENGLIDICTPHPFSNCIFKIVDKCRLKSLSLQGSLFSFYTFLCILYL